MSARRTAAERWRALPAEARSFLLEFLADEAEEADERVAPGDAVAGREAEELRAGIERRIADPDERADADNELQRLLDRCAALEAGLLDVEAKRAAAAAEAERMAAMGNAVRERFRARKAETALASMQAYAETLTRAANSLLDGPEREKLEALWAEATREPASSERPALAHRQRWIACGHGYVVRCGHLGDTWDLLTDVGTVILRGGRTASLMAVLEGLGARVDPHMPGVQWEDPVTPRREGSTT
jgi:hypothetical protein